MAEAWEGFVRLKGETLEALAARHGGALLEGPAVKVHRLVPPALATAGDLAPLLSSRQVAAAREAARRGAALLVEAELATRVAGVPALWARTHAAWAMAGVLDEAMVPDCAATVGEGSSIAPSAVLGPRVVIGKRVRVGAGTVIGHPGFGWAFGAGGQTRAVPQLGGVVLEDDVCVGPLCTIDAGTLQPTRLRRGAKLDAHVHVGHNVDIGEDTIVAAQCGFAGSVTLGRGVQVGGQAGVADHVVVGDGARIAAKSGVIGDVPPGAVVAGYPAVPRARWLRALAALHRGSTRRR